MKKNNMGNLAPVTNAIINMASQEVLSNVLRRIIDNTALDVNVLNEMLLGIYEEPRLVPAFTDDKGIEYRLLCFNPFAGEVLSEYDSEIVRYHDSDAKAKDAERRGDQYAGSYEQTGNNQFVARIKVLRRRTFAVANWPTEE